MICQRFQILDDAGLTFREESEIEQGSEPTGVVVLDIDLRRIRSGHVIVLPVERIDRS
jgi:hypothetical protein